MNFSASSFSRVMQCPGSVYLSEGVTQPATPAMIDGTVAHWKIAQAWRKQSTEGCDAATMWALDTLHALEADGWHVQVERALSVTRSGVILSGTLDVLLTKFRDGGGVDELRVIDWKGGEDATADSHDHLPQLTVYGYVARSWAGGDSSTKVTAQTAYPAQQRLGRLLIASGGFPDLERACDAVAALKDAPKNRLSLVPGDECGGCPARTICPARRFALAEVVSDGPVALGGDDLPAMLAKVRAAEKFIEEVKAAIKARLLELPNCEQTTDAGTIYMKRSTRAASPSYRAAVEWLEAHGFGAAVAAMKEEFALLPSVKVEHPELRRAKK